MAAMGGRNSSEGKLGTLLAGGQHNGTMRHGCTLKTVKPTSTVNDSRKALLRMGERRAEV